MINKVTGLLMLFSMLICLSCHNNYQFEREMDFGQGWTFRNYKAGNHSHSVYSKCFKLDVDADKIYLLKFDKKLQVNDLSLNNHKIEQGIFIDGTSYFNLTPHLKSYRSGNSLELWIDIKTNAKSQQLFDGSRLLCVNRLFIPSVVCKYNCSTASSEETIELTVRNSFETEQQAVLRYSYLKGDEVTEIVTTPVFIAGKSENFYQHTIAKVAECLTAIECELYIQGVLMDHHKVVIK